MKDNILRKILTALVIICGFGFLELPISMIGGGGVLNEMDLALREIEDLEKKNILTPPPKNLSADTKFYLSQYHNSSRLKQHIKEYEVHLRYRTISSCIALVLFFLSLILRIYFRKGKQK